MLKNYMTSVWRYILRNKAFTFINVTGLAIGMTAFLLIIQYVMHELSYDTFWKNNGRVFRVQLDRYNKGELTTRWAAGCAGIGLDLKANFPEVKSFVRMHKSNALLSHGDTFFKEENVYYVSQDFFKVFSYPLLSGVDSLALKGPNKMVLSRSLAKKYFGNEDPVGKTLRNNGTVEFLVTGIFEDFPENSHMKLDAMLSFATYAIRSGAKDESEMKQWQWDGFHTYVLLNSAEAGQALEAKLPAFVIKHEGLELKKDDAAMVFHLQPLKNIHLDSNFMWEFKANGDRSTVYFLLVVAAMIILIAWINYINLSTAKSIERAREVGVRKVMGGFRSQLIQQFLFESFILNVLSVVIAIVAVILFTPWFSRLTGRELDFLLFRQSMFWLWAGVVILGGTLLSGLYPAFVLSSYRPVEVLKGRFKNSSQGVLFRKGMVVTQFITSITLIAGTYTVYLQLNFMRNQKLGVNIDQTLVIKAPNVFTDSLYRQQFEALKQRLKQYPEVETVCASTSVPGAQPDWNAGGIRRLSQREEESNQYRVVLVDHDYIKLYGLEVLTGRGFSGDVVHEEKNLILNESASRLMGFAKIEDAINDKVFFWGDTFRIVGVMKNFRQESMKKSFEPLLFRYGQAPEGYYSVRLHVSDLQKSLARFEAVWKEKFPGNPFSFFFLDEYYNHQYEADQQFGQVFGIFSGLAIFIACLGLFGLSSLTALQRTKEIGVRKVLGASLTSVLKLMSRDYFILMLIAIVFAWPLTWWIMNSWLADFASRISLSVWIFALPSLAIILIALLTVSIHTLKAARTNPSRSLRYE